MDDSRRFFKRGLGALAPTLLTIALLMWAYRFVDQNIGRHVTRLVVKAYAWGGRPEKWVGIDREVALRYGDPIDEWDPLTGMRMTAQYKSLEALSRVQSDDPQVMAAAERAEREILWDLAIRKWWMFNAIGFVLAILIIYFVGYFLASFIGRRTWVLVENTIQRIPVISAIYPNIKQVTDLFISDKKLEFGGVVAVEYPRKGLWSIGLVTGPPMKHLAAQDTRDLVTVFVPSSPTPFTGYTITVARSDLIELPLTIDEALRYTVSGGIVRPGEMPKPGHALCPADGTSPS